jgi:hypothetical protein
MKIYWARVAQIIILLWLLHIAYQALHATLAHIFVLTMFFSFLFFAAVGPLTSDDETDTGDDL